MNDEPAAADIELGGEDAPAPDPFAETEADPTASLGGDGEPVDVSELPEEERLGGEGAELGEEPPPQVSEVGAEPEEEPPPAPEEEPVPEPQPEEEPPAPAEEPEPTEEPPAAPAEEPVAEEPVAEEPAAEDKPKKAKAKPKGKGKGKGKSPDRKYVILAETEKGWVVPSALPDGLEAKNTEQALRAAFDILSPDSDEPMNLVAVPSSYWKPKPVGANQNTNRSITVG